MLIVITKKSLRYMTAFSVFATMSVFQLKDFDQCCRCCLIKARQLESLFGVQLGEMLSEILNMKVEINDGYPAQMCVNCIRKMTMAVNFKRLVLASYEKLTDIIKNPNNTVNNATEDNAIDLSDEEKHVLTINDNSNIYNTDKVKDLNNETVCNAEVVVWDGHESIEHVNGPYVAASEDAVGGNTHTAVLGGHLCTQCGKWFKWRTSLNKHARTHDGRLYRCHVCGNQYADSYYLRIHERKHSSEDGKPFACRLCASRYADSNSLKRHETKIHPRTPQLAPERVPRHRGGTPTCADAEGGIVPVHGNDSCSAIQTSLKP